MNPKKYKPKQIGKLLYTRDRFPYNQKLKEKARDLRNNMTSQEKKLWYEFLSGHKAHFRRQKVIGNYIVDFYSARNKLAIEIDGDSHFIDTDKEQYDRERTDFLQRYGVQVLRFTNLDIKDGFDGVCKAIDDFLTRA